MLGELIGGYNNLTFNNYTDHYCFCPTRYNFIFIVGYNNISIKGMSCLVCILKLVITEHSFGNVWTLSWQISSDQCLQLLDDHYISVHEGPLDHHNSRDNHGIEWQWRDRTYAGFLFAATFIEGIPLNLKSSPNRQAWLFSKLINLLARFPKIKLYVDLDPYC